MSQTTWIIFLNHLKTHIKSVTEYYHWSHGCIFLHLCSYLFPLTLATNPDSLAGVSIIPSDYHKQTLGTCNVIQPAVIMSL